jgi:Protein of unknown function (DUF3224)
MKFAARWCAALAASAGVAAAMAATGAATPPNDQAGVSFLTGRTVTSFQQADGNLFITTQETRAFVGGISGTAVEEYSIVVRGDTFSFHGRSTCTCTIDGRSGTVVMRVVGDGNNTTGAFSDHREGLAGSATGGLEGLHISADVSGVGGIGNFVASSHFEP